MIEDVDVDSPKVSLMGMLVVENLGIEARSAGHTNGTPMSSFSLRILLPVRMDPGPPEDRAAFFESNRNLFYVACSRPKRRLALLFTQVLSAAALGKVSELFGEENVIALSADPSAASLNV